MEAWKKQILPNPHDSSLQHTLIPPAPSRRSRRNRLSDKSKKRKEKDLNMENLIGHVINGRIFKQISDAVFGRKRRSAALRFGKPSSTIEIRHNTAEFQTSQSDIRVPPRNDFEHGPITREQGYLSPLNTEGSAHAREEINAERRDTKLLAMEGSESIRNTVNEGETSSRPWNANTGLMGTEDHPPLTARRLQIHTFPGGHGEMSSALSLTKTLVWQLNKVLYCEPAIAECVKEINTTKAQRAELEIMLVQLNEQLQQATDVEDYNQTLETLQGAEDIAVGLQEHEQAAEQKHLELREELDSPRAQLFSDLKRVLQMNNLLEGFKEENDDVPDDEMQQTGNFEEKSPTPSEAAQNAAEEERDGAIEALTQLERRLRDARLKVENWDTYYDEEYRDYCRCAAERTLETTKSQFDVILLREAQQATGDLIRVEKDLEDAEEQARRLGIVLNDEDQESNFADNIDDGYRESMEAGFINSVDRSFIKRWMSEEEGTPHHSTSCDNWDSKTVDFGDSISVVAEGKERKRIDRWRSICEQLKTDALECR